VAFFFDIKQDQIYVNNKNRKSLSLIKLLEAFFIKGTKFSRITTNQEKSEQSN